MADYPIGGHPGGGPPPTPQYAPQPTPGTVPHYGQPHPTPQQQQYPQGQYSQQGVAYPQGGGGGGMGGAPPPTPQYAAHNQQQPHPQQWIQPPGPAPPTNYQAPPTGYQAPPTGQQPGYQASPTGQQAPATGYQTSPTDYHARPTGFPSNMPAAAGGYPPPPQHQTPAGYGPGPGAAPYHPTMAAAAAPPGQYSQQVQHQQPQSQSQYDPAAAAYEEERRRILSPGAVDQRSHHYEQQQEYRGAPPPPTDARLPPRDAGYGNHQQYQDYRGPSPSGHHGHGARPEPVYGVIRRGAEKEEWRDSGFGRREESAAGGGGGGNYRNSPHPYQDQRMERGGGGYYDDPAVQAEELRYRRNDHPAPSTIPALSLLNHDSPPTREQQRGRERGRRREESIIYDSQQSHQGYGAAPSTVRRGDTPEASPYRRPTRSDSPDYWTVAEENPRGSEEWLRTMILSVLVSYSTVEDNEKNQKMVTVEFLTKLIRSYDQGKISAEKGYHFDESIRGFMRIERDVSWLRFLKEMRDDGLLKIHSVNMTAQPEYAIYAPMDRPADWVSKFPITD